MGAHNSFPPNLRPEAPGTMISTVYPSHQQTSWITAQRPPRSQVDPFQPHGFFLERERSLSGRVLTSGCILLTSKECPWRCLMCDLWKNTLPHALPPAAVPLQIEFALSRLDTVPEQVKLYNSGSFFDSAAIPLADYGAIADRVSFAEHVIVESHPRLVGEKALKLRDRLRGSLEVAMGLETIHPKVLPRLNKQFTVNHFSESAAFLRCEDIAVRAFVLVKPPFLNDEEAIEWAVKSCDFAFACGAGVVSLIPTRAGNGALDRLRAAGEFAPPELWVLEQALQRCLALRAGRVFADTWDLEQFSVCPDCFEPRRQRLQAINLSQEVTPPIGCSVCQNGLKAALPGGTVLG